MVKKNELIDKAHSLGFDDIGFTTAEPFETQRDILLERKAGYEWAMTDALDLLKGTDPTRVWPKARGIVVLMENFFKEAFPSSLERNFGRVYLDDDRIAKDRLAVRIKDFMAFLRERGVESKASYMIPHRIAAARAGVGTFGKNSLLYANRMVAGGSWVTPIPIMMDREFPPDEPTFGRREENRRL